MGYKLLGFVVWKGAGFYFRHRVNTRTLLVVGGVVVVGAGALAVALRDTERDTEQ